MQDGDISVVLLCRMVTLGSIVMQDGDMFNRFWEILLNLLFTNVVSIWSAYSCCSLSTHDAAQSVGPLWTSDQLVAETST
jgi:hypothetical protein